MILHARCRRSRRRVHTFCRRYDRQSEPQTHVIPLRAFLEARKSEAFAHHAVADLPVATLLITAPSGMSPVSTYRHNATASLRASATSMMRRIRGDWPIAFSAYQRASALSL